MKQKLHQIWRALVGLSDTSAVKTELRPLFLYAGHVCKKGLQTSAKRTDYWLLLLFTVLSSSAAMAQTITGNGSVCVGATTAFGASVSGGSWSSSNTAVAAVDPSSGVVTGVGSGTATISYTISDASVTSTITVNSVLSAGSITGPSTICIDSSLTLTNSGSGGVWSSDNGVISVNSATGVITAVAMGSANIIYTVSNTCGSASTGLNVTVNGYTNDIYTFAGTGTLGFSGDGGDAYLAQMGDPRDLFVEPTSGNLFFCDPTNNRVREITRAGIITTVAGNGTAGNPEDGLQATATPLNAPNGIFVDNSGNMFISNTYGASICKVSPSGIISTIAGTGTAGLSGDGGAAIGAKLNFPLGILEDASGNVYFADNGENDVRKIAAGTGIITTVVGSPTGAYGYSGDGGQATAAAALLHGVKGLTMDNKGNIYIADGNNNVIRKYVPSTGIITTIAGTGTAGHIGDGGPATVATLTTPARFAYDGANNLYLSDQSDNAIRVINLATGIITQVAGIYGGTGTYGGDFGSALSAHLNTPAGIAGDHFGNFYIADAENYRIRTVPSTGSLSAAIVGPDTVCTGTSVTLTAFLSSTGSPTYQWQKNGSNVGGGGASYTDASPSNGDVYRCIVTVTPGCSASFKDTSNNITVGVSQTAAGITAPSTLYPGQSEQLGETVPGGTWSSSSTLVATVNSAGMLYGLSVGTAVITYAVTNACGTSTTNVSVLINTPDTVMASSGSNGTITPNGPVIVNGGGQTFYFSPATGYHITSVVVNGDTVAYSSYTYTFSSVTSTQMITAIFAPDCSGPAITVCPSNVTANNATGSCGATVTYSAATAGGTAPTITYSQNSGTSFSVGTTIVTVNATNSCGSATCTFNVTVNDTQAPTITAPANVTVTGHCNAVTPALGTATTADNCGVATVTNNAPSSFSPGTTVVLWTVTDVHGNTATATQTVTVTPATITPATTITNVTCYGLSNGGIIASATGGTAPYTYSWSGGEAATATLSGLPMGTYSVTVTDANSCTATTSVTVGQPSSVLSASSTATSALCNGGSTGTVTVSATGGTSPYSGTGTFSGKAAGSYTYTVTDANSCTTTTSVSVGQPSTALSASATATSALCNGGSTGTVTVSATGGTSPYSGTGTFSGKAAGSYTYTVTDANSCTTTTSVSVGQPSTALSASSTATSALCNGGSTGTVSISATGGTSPYSGTGTFSGKAAGSYTYTVTDANSCTTTTSVSVGQPSTALSASSTATSALCNGGSTGTVSVSATGGTSPYSGTGTFSGKAAGSYTYTVTDANSCTATTSVSVGQPSTALTISGTPANVNCYGASTGSITTTASGGTGTYTYLWSTGATSSGLSNMAAGTYSVTVTDVHSCTANASYPITQPSAALTVTGTPTAETCYGASTGSVTTSVSGGTASYNYLWSTGATTSGISGKTAGTYSVTVTDARSCTTTGSYTITQPSAFTVGGTPTNVTGCYGSTNGSITTSVSGGTSAYSYLWSPGSATTSGISGKAAGTYSVTVTDAHSCTTSNSFTITQPAQLSSTIGGIGNDSVLAGVTNTFTSPAASGCTYSWSVSGGSASISGSTSGSSVSVLSPCSATVYTVTLNASQSGCSSTSHTTINVIESATITAYCSQYTTSCGYYPSVSKTTLPCSLKVYNRHICGPQDGVQSHYSSVWNGTTGQVTNCVISAPTCVNIGGGPAYQYTITVPANGHYLVIGQSTISSSYYGGSGCTLYTAQKAGDYDCVDGSDYTDDYPLTPCTTPQQVFHCALQNNNGYCQEGCVQQQHGSLLLIVTPMAIVFDDSVETLPVIYESVEGDWSASVTATPPDGFYALPADSLSTSVTDSNINAVQFTIADTGSVWTNTELQHTLFHKGAYRTVYSHPKMINNRTNKLSALTLEPNPAKDMVRVGFPRFEGKATLGVYNMLGQKMMEQKINIVDGTSVSLDVSKLVPGIYLVSAENGSGKVTSRLLKQ